MVRVFFLFILAIPARRKSRAKSLGTYNRDVRIDRVNLGASTSRKMNVPLKIKDVSLRRSSRVSVPVKNYNCGQVRCSVCGRTFRDDISVEHYTARIVCSFNCFNNRF